MIILTLFAFLAGVITILSPCILPVLPIILATSITGGDNAKRPYGIITGFVLSFTLATLFLSQLVKFLGIPSDALRALSIIVIALFGCTLLVPRFQILMESLFARLANLAPSSVGRSGYGGGVVIGLSLGLLWTPCVGPILASVIALAISGSVTLQTFFITLAYSVGTAIPMLLIILGGQKVLTRAPWLLRNTGNIQRGFGVLMILLSLGLYLGFDRSFQTYVLSTFPQYGAGLTKIEDAAVVKTKIDTIGNRAPELVVGGEWINSDPLTLESLRGKVVLIDFWTYSCINCQRTLPYLKAWDQKYRDKGLVIIGVHAPEFEFEKIGKNVETAVKDFGIEYPVMQDNDFATWRAYKNQYWPAKYFIDKDGNIRHTHFGEGDYDESEAVIQDLLKETGVKVEDSIKNVEYATYARTPETYLGTLRSQGESYIKYEGNWAPSSEFTMPSAGAKLTLTFDAKNVYLVMRNTGVPAKFKVYVDDKLMQEVVVTEDKLYTIVSLDTPGRHKVRLEFEDGNAELFAFTFG